MAKKNDNAILALKQKIEVKKAGLKASERFSPITNASLLIEGTRYNLNVIGKEQTIELLVKVNAMLMSAKELGVEESYQLGGFLLEDWVTDLKSRWAIVDRKAEEERLKKLEATLHQLLSVDKKVELELADIAALI